MQGIFNVVIILGSARAIAIKRAIECFLSMLSHFKGSYSRLINVWTNCSPWILIILWKGRLIYFLNRGIFDREPLTGLFHVLVYFCHLLLGVLKLLGNQCLLLLHRLNVTVSFLRSRNLGIFNRNSLEGRVRSNLNWISGNLVDLLIDIVVDHLSPIFVLDDTILRAFTAFRANWFWWYF